MKANARQAKAHFSRLLQRVAGGEEISIIDAGVPVARLVPVAASQSKRQLGIDEGKIWMADDFDTPSPEIEKLFTGAPKPTSKPAERK